MTNRELEQWAASRETSTLIALAIQEISTDQNEMNEIWEDPTQAQIQEILNILVNDIAADGLCWGMATLTEEGVK